MDMTVSLLWSRASSFFLPFSTALQLFCTHCRNVGVVYVSFTKYDPFCALMIFTFPSNHFVASHFETNYTFSSVLLFRFALSSSVNSEPIYTHRHDRHDEKLFSWLVMHSFPFVIVWFCLVFWLWHRMTLVLFHFHLSSQQQQQQQCKWRKCFTIFPNDE